MLELKGVTKKYKEKKVVDNLSFSVEGGQVLGLLGAILQTMSLKTM